MKKILPLLALLAMCGCALVTPPVPESRFDLQLGPTQRLRWHNPKNFTTTNIVVTYQTNGEAKVSIGSASSMNDPSALNAGYSGQAAYMDSLTRFVQTLGLTAAPKP
jgi:hypothetical protein